MLNSRQVIALVLIGFLTSCYNPIDPISEIEAKVLSPTSVKLNWTKLEKVGGYRLFKNDKLIYEGLEITFTDGGLMPESSITYSVSAFRRKKESYYNKTIFVDLPPAIPSKPLNLKVVDSTEYSIKLTWEFEKKSKYPVEFEVFKNNVLVDKSYSNSYYESNFSLGINASYYVKAVNITGKSEASNDVLAKTKVLVIKPADSVPLIHNITTAGLDPNNFLLEKKQFKLSYNNHFRHSNWAYWEINKTWLGSAERSNDFFEDNTLPSSFNKVRTTDYQNSGFDRGHLCPSADRTSTDEDNRATFVMSNMVPQAPAINRGTIADFEEFCRDVVSRGFYAEVVTGAIGTGGTGTRGFFNSIGPGINVPQYFYKTVVFTKNGQPSDENSRIVNVFFPNNQNEHLSKTWTSYLTTTSKIESHTKTKILKHKDSKVERTLTNQEFNHNENPFGFEIFVRYYNGHRLKIGPKGGCYYFNSNGNKTYVDRSLCGN